MGNYINAYKLQQHMGDVRYRNLCAGEYNELVAESCIGRAEAIIDAFAAGRYAVPMPVCSRLEEWALGLAEYEAYKKRMPDDIPARVREAFLIITSLLSDLAGGRLELEGNNAK